jgi:hypothetical protein
MPEDDTIAWGEPPPKQKRGPKPGHWSQDIQRDTIVWGDPPPQRSLHPARPCPECHNQFGGKMPGHTYGSNWDFVPCQTCHGTGFDE